MLSMAACSEMDYQTLDGNGVPESTDVDVTATVDQTTNTATLNMTSKTGEAFYPIWIIDEGKNTVYSTQNQLQKIFSAAGNHTVSYRVGNKNGISAALGTVSFNIENSLKNFDEIYALLCGRNWRIANSEAGHLGCGESGTDGLNWYSAGADEKKDMGLYDDIITFATDGTYTYNPGEGGTVFVNTGCSLWSQYNSGSDFMVPVEAQTASYELSVEGDDTYITLPANTLFPYISNDTQWANPKFRLESLTASQMVLIYDNGSIAWHFIFTSLDEDTDTGFHGYDADSDCNLFKSCTYTNTFWYADSNWGQLADPGFTQDGNSYTLSFPTANSQQWQGQVFFHTDMTTNSVESYDFSCVLTSTKDHPSVTVKLTAETDDNTYYFADVIQLKAYEDYVFYKEDMAGLDIENVKLVFDFGGCAENTEVTIKDICLQEHGCDGTVIPIEYDTENNLWKSTVDDNNAYSTYIFYAPNWAEIKSYEFTGDHGEYVFKLPEATSQQWQSQLHITPTTNLAMEADTKYNFACTITSTTDISGVTFKLTDASNDGNYLFTYNQDIKAYEETTITLKGQTMLVGAADNAKMVFDFGGNPANSEITIKNITLEKAN